MPRSDWLAKYPSFAFLSAGDVAGVNHQLDAMQLISADEAVVSAEKAGEGNMNLTLRAVIEGPAGKRRLIVKQSRPWVEKYDFIDAPWDRAVMEAGFYQAVSHLPEVANQMPGMLGVDDVQRIVVFEDLGTAADLTPCYSGKVLPEAVLSQLGTYARTLHDGTKGRADGTLINRGMRDLNFQHIYVIPLADKPMLDLDGIEAGLAAAAKTLREDASYRKIVETTGRRYLSDGDHLLHGDFFPGSWVTTAVGVRVIDPEFCFFGDREFDIGVALAHLALSRQPKSAAMAMLSAYGQEKLDSGMLAHVAGAEVMRRLIGLAQLPISNFSGRSALLLLSREVVLTGDVMKFWS